MHFRLLMALVVLALAPIPARAGQVTISALASGTAFGSVAPNPALQDQFVNITLNAAAIAALQACAGVGSIALGGGYTPNSGFGYAFANGGFPPEQSNLKQLIVQVSDVPEPGSMVLTGIAMAWVVGRRLCR